MESPNTNNIPEDPEYSAYGDDEPAESDITHNPKPLAHQLANVIYWVSVILLLVAARELIRPGDRKPGDIAQIYMTIVAFEIYMWLLVGLNKWHFTRELMPDSARSIIFTMALGGFMFMNLNELYLADSDWAMPVSAAALITCLVRMRAMFKAVRLKISHSQAAYLLGWLALTAAPAPLFKLMSHDARYLNAILYCWLLALYLTVHIYAIKRQRAVGYVEDEKNPFRNWYAGWAALAVMFACAFGQCASVIYVFADFSYWYFSPVIVTLGVLALAMAYASRRAIPIAWLFLAAALLFISVAAASQGLPKHFPKYGGACPNELALTYMNLGMGYLLNPYLPSIIYGSLVFLLSAALLTIYWMMLLAAVAPTVFTAAKIVQMLARSKSGKGVTMLLGAFALLGAGVLIQWTHEKWHRNSYRNSDN